MLDARAGTFLQLDVIDAPDAFRKLLRAQLATPLRQRDRFEIEFRWAWPEPEERNMDCIGFKFQQLAHGLEKAELIVDFEIAPWDVRFFKLKGSTVTEEQPSFQLLSSPDKSMACRYQLDLHEPTNEQWLMVWFAELKSEADTI
ncbi:MAG: hypothetical protein JWM41_504 [Gemmatimonadetes bacterium]|nr:hypothetical protein [Gemmatimonadota bacterium]